MESPYTSAENLYDEHIRNVKECKSCGCSLNRVVIRVNESEDTWSLMIDHCRECALELTKGIVPSFPGQSTKGRVIRGTNSLGLG